MDPLHDKALGANISEPDNRRILLAKVQAPVPRPKIYRADDNDIPVEDQKDKGSCVGQAEGGEIEYREKIDTGTVTPVSKRWIYDECKLVDNNPDQGTYPTVAAALKVSKGAPKKSFLEDNNDLPYAEYIKKPGNSQELLDDAGLRVAEGYAFVQPNLEDVLQAIYQNGTFTITVMVGDWSSCPVKPSPARGAHRIRLNGYEELPNGDAKIYFRNSWGKFWNQGADEFGNGWFLWSDYKLSIYEMIVYTDIPLAVILKARATLYQFTRTLKYKMTGTDVTELQKRLSREPAFDGEPCYAYKENGVLYFSTYFGLQTQNAVQRYQKTKGIVSSGTPETTGYGQVGPGTRASLNSQVVIHPELFPKVADLRDKLKAIMAAAGHPIVITDEYRTFSEQDALYAKGRTVPGLIVTNAKGGESLHNYRCAFDVAFSSADGISYDGPWPMVGLIGKILGLEWGGEWSSFQDKPHFQFTAGYTLSQFQNGQIDESKFA